MGVWVVLYNYSKVNLGKGLQFGTTVHHFGEVEVSMYQLLHIGTLGMLCDQYQQDKIHQLTV